MRIALYVVAAVVLVVFIAIGYVIPGMAEAKAKSAAKALLTGAEAAKAQIGKAAERSGSLAGSGRGVKVDNRSDATLGALKWVVSEDGAVRGWNGEYAIQITLTPSLKGGKVAWSCSGYPRNAMPQGCGGA